MSILRPGARRILTCSFAFILISILLFNCDLLECSPSADSQGVGSVPLEFLGMLILIDGVSLAVPLGDGYGMLPVSAQNKAGNSVHCSIRGITAVKDTIHVDIVSLCSL